MFAIERVRFGGNRSLGLMIDSEPGRGRNAHGREMAAPAADSAAECRLCRHATVGRSSGCRRRVQGNADEMYPATDLTNGRQNE